jgi:UDP:flavonoid glycosyltransferase YjiC (YdhE family)
MNPSDTVFFLRVLFVSAPAWGHIHLMLPLAQAFVERGDEVLWATGEDARGALEANGIPTASAGLTSAETSRELDLLVPDALLGRLREHLARGRTSDGVPSPDELGISSARHFAGVIAPLMLDDLLPLVDSWKPSLLIHEDFEFAGAIAAAAGGIPSVTVSDCCLLPARWVAAAAEAVAPLWKREGLDPRPYGGSYEHLYIDRCPPSLQEPDAERVPAAQAMRPAVAGRQVDVEALQPLVRDQAEGPFVFISFGTVVDRGLSLLRSVVEALRDLEVRLLVTTDPRADPAWLGPQPPNVHVAGFIEQEEAFEGLLASCAAAITHGGAGTVLRGLAHGLPQLTMPRAADQVLTAGACERAGVGVMVPPEAAANGAVRAATERVLSDPELGRRAARVGAEIARMPPPEEVTQVLVDRFG